MSFKIIRNRTIRQIAYEFLHTGKISGLRGQLRSGLSAHPLLSGCKGHCLEALYTTFTEVNGATVAEDI